MPDRIIPSRSLKKHRILRTTDGVDAWLTCSIGAALVGSTFFTIGMAAYAGASSFLEIILVSLGRLVLGLIFTSLLILIATAVVAPPVTWIVARIRLENSLFYTVFGAGCGFVAGWLLSGDTAAFPFERMTLLSSPVFGGAWGLLWWLVYRRHIVKGSALNGTGIVG